MWPRLPSAITSSPARFAYWHTCSKAAIPAAPSASKNASWGLTATACGATASTIPQQKRATSPRSSTGSRSGCGSSPTTSCERLRSTSAASRSAKVSGATGTSRNGNARRGRRLSPPPGNTESFLRLVLERGLELAAGRELRHGRGGDLDPLAGARIDALPRRPGGSGELAEAREVDRVAGLQRLGDRLEERVDGLPRVPGGYTAFLCNLIDEALLGQGRNPPRSGCWGTALVMCPPMFAGSLTRDHAARCR